MASDGIRQLGKHTLVYGAGYVFTRMIPFFLLPFYTHFIDKADYGVVSLIYASIGFMNIIFHYGLDSAFLRFFSKESEEYSKKDVFSTALLSLLVSGLVLSTLISIFSEPISKLLLGTPEYSKIISYAGFILLVDTLFNIPLHYLRMANKPIVFNVVNIINVTINFILNILFLRFLNKGLEYIFISNLLASSTTLLLLVPIIVKNWSGKINISLWKKLVFFGLPFIPGGLASMVLELIGRYMLQWMTDLETVGLYSAGYKLGIFMLVIITAYKFAWQPFFLNKGNDPNAPKLFAQIMTYFIFVLVGIYLVISFFIHEIITFRFFGVSFFGESYWAAEPVVPIILAAYIFLGIYMNLLPAIYFSEKTYIIPIISGSAAIVNVVANYLLIPEYGMIGASYATLIAYVWMAIFTYLITKNWYRIPYNKRKISMIFISGFFISFTYYYFGITSIFLKLILVLMYPAMLLGTKIIVLPKSLNIFKS